MSPGQSTTLLSRVHMRRQLGALLASAACLLAPSSSEAEARPDDAISGFDGRPVEAKAEPSFPTEALPSQLNGVGIDERLGEQVPLDLQFLDEAGRSVQLGDLFEAEVPVIITLNYSDCPMLCSLELNGLVNALRQVDLNLGESYRVVTVSLDPEETPEVARQTQQRYLARYRGAPDAQGREGEPRASAGWHFLTGAPQSIAALTGSIGFNYRYDAQKHQYYHAAAFVLASPAGKLTRYLYGIEYDPRTLKLGLVEASQGKIGSSLDKLILFCSTFDPREGSYAMVAGRMIRVGSVISVSLLAGFLLLLWRREAGKKQRRELRG